MVERVTCNDDVPSSNLGDGTTNIMKDINHTNRGFAIVEFTDTHNNKCSLQKSSSAMYDAVWLGIGDPEINVMVDGGWKALAIPEGAVVNSRMHLTQKQVRELIPLLQHFADHGELPKPG